MGWRRVFERGRRDADAARELQSYIEIETADNIARGMRADDARHAAHRKLGNVTRIREEIYVMNSMPFDALWQDVRYAVRLLRRDKAFAAAAVLSLTLGIGANTAIFQLLDAIRLRTLPVERPEELAELRLAPGQSRTGQFNGRRPMWTFAQIEELRRHLQGFTGLAVWSAGQFNSAPAGEARFVDGLLVSGDFFTTLGVGPALGRLIGVEDDRRGCAPVAVLSHAYWQRAFAGDPDALGQMVLLNGVSFPVIGVTAPSFFGVDVGRQFDVAIPICADEVITRPGRLDRLDGWWLAAIGRLGEGWAVERAAAHVGQLSAGVFAATLPATYQAEDVEKYLALKATVVPAAAGVSGLRADFAEPLTLLLAISGLVLIVACANLANLLLARATAREREIAARLALGASRARVLRQLLVESVLLATLGALAGAWVGDLLSRSLVAVLATNYVALFVDLTWDARLFAFTAGVATLACILFGLAPAVRATAVAPAAVLKSGGRGLTEGHRRFGLRQTLVVAQVTVSLILIIGGVLFMRTAYQLATEDPGFRADGLVVMSLSALPAHPPGAGAQAERQALVRELSALPDVAAAVEAYITPLTGRGFWNENVIVDGLRTDERLLANFNRVEAGYFSLLGIPLLSGRDFNDRDTLQSPPVAVISREFVRRFLPDAEPVGRTLRLLAAPGDPQPAYQIVGVVGDTKYAGVRDVIEPLVYLSASQEGNPGQTAQVVVRPRGSVSAMTAAVLATTGRIAPGSFLEVSLWEQEIRNSMVRERLMATLSGAFAAVAVVLAAVGLYGLLAYAVARRTQELGLRMAMGATRGNVLRLLLGEAAVLIVTGVVCGTVVAALATRWTASLLYGIAPFDPMTFVAAPLGLLVIGLAACAVPARRATRVDPAVALRND